MFSKTVAVRLMVGAMILLTAAVWATAQAPGQGQGQARGGQPK